MGKKQEMSQVYHGSNNEFIFGDHGGKGKNLSSFLKNLLLTGLLKKHPTALTIDDSHAHIYGLMNKGTSRGGSRPTDSLVLDYASKRPQTKRTMSGSLKGLRRRTNTYTDLDDDWDAGIEDELTTKTSAPTPKSLLRVVLLQHGYVDLFFPELGVVGSEPSRVSHDDEEDVLAKLEISKLNQLQNKYLKFKQVMTTDSSVDIADLRKLSWSGIPPEMRAMLWQLLLGYLPTNKARQALTLKRKRDEYVEGFNLITVDFDELSSYPQIGSEITNLATNKDKALDHQIKIDVKRTNPTQKFYSLEPVQRLLRKILYLWAVRHPASGYVQGINDLATPFFQIFVMNYVWQLQRQKLRELDPHLMIPGLLVDDAIEHELLDHPDLLNLTIDTLDPQLLSPKALVIIEADTYWCLLKLLENITDNYIHEQPGIHRQVNDLRNLVAKIDVDLLNHFDREGIEFLQFSFRWMNCLLMREMLIDLIIRMWDTYLSEQPLGFNNFHVYVCAAFLIKFATQLKLMDFQEIILFLQNPPTQGWTDKDVELMLSEAFIWQSLYKNASAHLR